MWRLILALFAVLLLAVVSVTTLPVPIEGSSGALVYLTRYGYLRPNANSQTQALTYIDFLTDGIKNLQVFAGLEVTGELDEATLRLMRTPRCGVQDDIGNNTSSSSHHHHTRTRRYALQGSRWKMKVLTYKISKYPSNMKKTEVDQTIAKAFKMWSEAADLTFQQLGSGRSHIDIRFERYEHGDGDPFDGRGGTLAHAYFPIYGGDAHFDDVERWTIASYSGVNLLQTASHEFGHSLGLSHSDVNSALMAPFYRGYDPNAALDPDDIKGIQALYGPPKSKASSGSGGSGSGSGDSGSGSGDSGSGSGDGDSGSGSDDSGSGSSDSGSGSGDSGSGSGDSGSGSGDSGSGSGDGDSGSGSCASDGGSGSCLCSDGRIDTIVTTEDGNTYVFRGGLYWLLNEVSVEEGYPRNISQDWDGLPDDLDAAFTWNGRKTFFFQGSKYWRFVNQKMDPGYPKMIRDGFTGIPDDLDTAFVRSRKRIYFFQGSRYWRYNTVRRPHVSSNYPQQTALWEGLPSDLDGSLHFSRDTTYFFKDGEYWRFNNRRFRVDDTYPPYPRPTAVWWFGCQDPTLVSALADQEAIVPVSAEEDKYDAVRLDGS